jgi:hypothetical protein
MKLIRASAAAWPLALALAGPASAAEVLLKSGGRLSGRIVERSEASITVDVGAGRITVPASSVVRIDEGRSALEDYEERAARLDPADVAGWLELAAWASAHGLGTQARQAYERVLAVAPGDPNANQALGKVQLNGRWVSEAESYRARGYVQHDGEWMTPAEQQAALRADAEAQRDRAQREADARVREAEERAREAERRAREAEAQQADEGLPVWYGWGAGPTVWPTGPIVVPARPVARPRAVPR